MPKEIQISIHPFGSACEQLWVGQVIDGQFTKKRLLAKVVQAGNITAKKSYDGKFGKPSTSEDWDIVVPDNFTSAIAKMRLSDATFTTRNWEFDVLYTPVA